MHRKLVFFYRILKKDTEMSEENQQKFIKAHPKKYQEKVKKILDDFKK